MCRWCSLLAALLAMAACADVPTPEAPWFAIDFAQPWEDSAGSWTATSNAETSCEWTAASARLSFEGYTNTPVAFTPTVAPGQEPAAIEATVTLVDLAISRTIPAVPEDGARGALSVVERADRSLVYMGLTAQGWVELAGTTPEVGAEAVYRISYDASLSPPRVSYSVDGRGLVSAADATVSSFEARVASGTSQVEFYGAGEVSSLAGSRELAERQAAVVRRDGSFDYHADLAAACGAATNGAEVVLLRRVAAMDWAATSNGTPLRLDARLAGLRQPIFAWQGELPSDAQLPLDMPSGRAVDCILFSAADAAAQSAVHVHGDPGVVYTLGPDASGVRLRSGAVSLDPAGLVGFLSVPEGAHAFVGNLGAGDLGTLQSLYLQGAETTLCGTNTYSGATVLESGTLNLCGSLTSTNIQVWKHGEYVGTAPTNGVLAVEGGACVDAPLASANTVLSAGASVAFHLSSTANGMVLIPHGALPTAGSVSVSVAVEGRYVATTRTALSGDVVAAVAGAPELATRCDAFAVAADGVTAVIANAVAGFWYAWEAADEPTGPFAPAGSPVRASLDGELEMSLAEPIRPRRFYRLCVSPAP